MKLNQGVREIVQGAFQLHQAGKRQEACEVYDRLLARIDYDDANLLYAYGTLLAEQTYYGIALQLLHKAVALAPDAAPAWSNLGMALKNVERYGEARAAWAKAVALEPNNPLCLTNMAGGFVNQNTPDKIVEWARKAVAADPEYVDAHLHLALGLLEQGKLEEAWPHYEYRWKMANRQKDVRPFKAPRWDGNRVGTLAVHGEQGLGDEIMFMSYFSEVAKKADLVLIECAPRLVELFKRSFGVPCYGTHDELIAAHGEPSAWVPMGSLARHTGSPTGKPYLVCAAHEPHSRPLIGLSWRGGTDKTNQTLRSIPLAKFAPIMSADADFISLQYGPDDVDYEAGQCGLKVLPDRKFETITDALSRCDIVISVCQTNVHLAGAMGIPCYVLTPQKSAWRYCRDHMEWYDSVELFKRLDGQSWDVPIRQIACRLRERHARAA